MKFVSIIQDYIFDVKLTFKVQVNVVVSIVRGRCPSSESTPALKASLLVPVPLVGMVLRPKREIIRFIPFQDKHSA